MCLFHAVYKDPSLWTGAHRTWTHAYNMSLLQRVATSPPLGIFVNLSDGCYYGRDARILDWASDEVKAHEEQAISEIALRYCWYSA